MTIPQPAAIDRGRNAAGGRRLRRWFWLVLLACMPLTAGALSSDSDKPVHLSADQAELNNATGVGVYTGDVVLTQGTLQVTGDIMRVYTGENRQIQRVEVEGGPATYRQLPDGESEYVRAQAPRMEYYAAGPQRIRLLDGATLWQGRNEFKGETIVYNVAEETVQAESGDQGKKRIEITLFPNRQNGEGNRPGNQDAGDDSQ